MSQLISFPFLLYFPQQLPFLSFSLLSQIWPRYLKNLIYMLVLDIVLMKDSGFPIKIRKFKWYLFNCCPMKWHKTELFLLDSFMNENFLQEEKQIEDALSKPNKHDIFTCVTYIHLTASEKNVKVWICWLISLLMQKIFFVYLLSLVK